MICREPTNYVTDCYFCAIDLTGINRKNRSSLTYPVLDAARRPVEKVPYLSLKSFQKPAMMLPPAFQKIIMMKKLL